MITNLEIENFKSISSKISLPFSPLTLLAGPNSSGKSSIIQPILLLSQSALMPDNPNQLTLDGIFTNFGDLLDLFYLNNFSKHISIGVSFSNAPSLNISFTAGIQHTNNLLSAIPIISHLKLSPLRIEAFTDPYLRFDSVFTNDHIFERLENNESLREVSVIMRSNFNKNTMPKYYTGSFPNLIPITKTSHGYLYNTPDINSFLSDNSFFELRLNDNFLKKGINNLLIIDTNADDILYNASTDSTLQLCLQSYSPGCLFKGCKYKHLYGLLPSNLSVSKCSFAVFMSKLFSSLANPSRGCLCNLFFEYPEFVDIAVNALSPFLGDNFAIEFDAMQDNYYELLKITELGSPAFDENEDKLMFSKMQEYILTNNIIPALYESLSYNYENATRKDSELHVEYLAGSYSTRQALNSIFYLGPLRCEPSYMERTSCFIANPGREKFTYNSLLPFVGTRGENVFNVLYNGQSESIKYLSPICFEYSPFNSVITESTLLTALNEWLRYLGIAYDLPVRHINYNKCQPFVRRFADGPGVPLPNVGVGVSQVLPILVIGLMSKPGAILVFEQPELHLHPKIQSRLCDFFLSLVLCNKQCIIETHSEHIMNRIRYHIASASEDLVGQLVKMYFVENINNQTKAKNVSINEYGAIVNWPDEFFDQGIKDADDILRAAIAKHTLRKKGKFDESSNN